MCVGEEVGQGHECRFVELVEGVAFEVNRFHLAHHEGDALGAGDVLRIGGIDVVEELEGQTVGEVKLAVAVLGQTGSGGYAAEGYLIAHVAHQLVLGRCVVGGHGEGGLGEGGAFLSGVGGHLDVGLGGGGRRHIAIHLNRFYTLTPHIATINGCSIYSRRLILFCGFYYKGSFAVCSSTIGVVIEYTFGDGISFGSGDGCYPSVSPPSPVSEVL